VALTGRVGTPISRPGDLQLGNPSAGGTYACLEASTYGGLAIYTYAQLENCPPPATGGPPTYPVTVTTTQAQAVREIGGWTVRQTQSEVVVLAIQVGNLRATQVELIVLQPSPVASPTVSTTQGQSLALGKAVTLRRSITQSQTLQRVVNLVRRLTVSATQTQAVARLRTLNLFRRISQSQKLTLPLRQGKSFKRTVTARQSEAVSRTPNLRTVTTTVHPVVSRVRQPQLRRTVTQPQSVRLLRGVGRVLRATQSTSASLLVRSNAVLLRITQAATASLSQTGSLTQIVSQPALAFLQIVVNTAQAIQQATALTFRQIALPIHVDVAAEQSTNVSLIQAPSHTELAQQAQAVSLLFTGGRVLAVAQPQHCSLIVQPIPTVPIQPVRVFSTCRVRRLSYAAPARPTTFRARPRETVFVARFAYP